MLPPIVIVQQNPNAEISTNENGVVANAPVNLQQRARKLKPTTSQLRTTKGQQITVLALISVIGLTSIGSRICWYMSFDTSPPGVVFDPRTDQMSLMLHCEHMTPEFVARPYGQYWLLQNYFLGTAAESVGCGQEVTLVTHGANLSIFAHLAEIVETWHAPISVALFTPGTDYDTALSSIQYLRNCLRNSNAIRLLISFHLFFPYAHMPQDLDNRPESAAELPYDCDAAPPYAQPVVASYAASKSLNYPVNVARNIARESTNTYFVMVMDPIYRPRSNFLDLFHDKVWSESFASKIKENRTLFFAVEILTSTKEIETSHNTDLLEAAYQPTTIYITSKYHVAYDERIMWTPDAWHDLPQLYGDCLQQIETIKIPDLTVFKNSTIGQHEVYMPEALNDTKMTLEHAIKHEYSLLFSIERADLCGKWLLPMK